MSNSTDLFNTLDQIFAEQHLSQTRRALSKKGSSAPTKDIEVALAVLLVDLASCDQTFNPAEYQIISKGLRRLFGASKEQVTALVNQANQIISSMRSTQTFLDSVKESLSREDKLIVMELIEEIIQADGKVDDFEIYLREKFRDALGLTQNSAE